MLPGHCAAGVQPIRPLSPKAAMSPLSTANQLTSFRIANKQPTGPEYLLSRAQAALDGAVHVALPFTARVFPGEKHALPWEGK